MKVLGDQCRASALPWQQDFPTVVLASLPQDTSIKSHPQLVNYESTSGTLETIGYWSFPRSQLSKREPCLTRRSRRALTRRVWSSCARSSTTSRRSWRGRRRRTRTCRRASRGWSRAWSACAGRWWSLLLTRRPSSGARWSSWRFCKISKVSKNIFCCSPGPVLPDEKCVSRHSCFIEGLGDRRLPNHEWGDIFLPKVPIFFSCKNFLNLHRTNLPDRPERHRWLFWHVGGRAASELDQSIFKHIIIHICFTLHTLRQLY